MGNRATDPLKAVSMQLIKEHNYTSKSYYNIDNVLDGVFELNSNQGISVSQHIALNHDLQLGDEVYAMVNSEYTDLLFKTSSKKQAIY